MCISEQSSARELLMFVLPDAGSLPAVTGILRGYSRGNPSRQIAWNVQGVAKSAYEVSEGVVPGCNDKMLPKKLPSGA